MTKDEISATRLHARLLIEMQQGMNHDTFVAAVTGYATENYGQTPETCVWAGRIARHAWDAYRPPSAERALGG